MADYPVPPRPPYVRGPCDLCHGVYGCAGAQWCYMYNRPRPVKADPVPTPPKDTP